ncbi:MAG: LysR family transcriptional regulator [Dehalococcoidia bacterium]
MDDFNWNDLKFFIAMARADGPSAAARALHVDHNTVRRRVAALESALQARLFDRRGDEYTMTDEGERLLRLAESMESIVATVHDNVADADMAVSGTVRIGVPDGLGTLFIPSRLAKLRQAHPHLNIELIVTSRGFNLSKRDADVAIMIDRPTDGRISVKRLCKVTLRLHASKTYLAQKPPIRAIPDLLAHDYVTGVDGFDFGPALNEVLQVASPSFVPRITCTSSVAQLKAAAAGCGLCFFANFMVADEPSLVSVLPDQVSVSREIWLAVHADLRALTRIKAVTRFLTDEFLSSSALFD